MLNKLIQKAYAQNLGPIPIPHWVGGVASVSRILINTLLGLLGVVAVIVLIYAGYIYITAGSNQEQAEKGKKTITGALIGIIIAFASYLIVNFIIKRLSQ